MMKRFLKGGLIAVILSLMLCLFTSCDMFGTTDSSDPSYWFSENTKEYVEFKYDDDGSVINDGNLDKAGTYWYLTAKKDIKGAIHLRDDAQYGSYTTFTINGNKITPKQGVEIYDFTYDNLNIKAGDKIIISVKWSNPVSAATYQREETISAFGIQLDGDPAIYNVYVDGKLESVPLS